MPGLARLLVGAATVALLIPFVLGAVRIARALGIALAVEALPAPGVEGGIDLAAAPRRALLVTLQIAILLVAGIPDRRGDPALHPARAGDVDPAVRPAVADRAAVAQRHQPARPRARRRAGAAGSAGVAERHAGVDQRQPTPAHGLPAMLPGLGNATTVRLAAGSAAIGRTLKQIDLRGLTGATVIAIDREPADVIYPTGDEVLTNGDTLIITGTTQAVQAAQELLAPPPGAEPGPDADATSSPQT